MTSVSSFITCSIALTLAELRFCFKMTGCGKYLENFSKEKIVLTSGGSIPLVLAELKLCFKMIAYASKKSVQRVLNLVKLYLPQIVAVLA